MGLGKCFQSLLMPWHNEWVNILLYLIFAIYFWVQLVMIMCGEHSYDFQDDVDMALGIDGKGLSASDQKYLMFIGTFGICVTLTMTAIYLTFYVMSEKTQVQLEKFNYMGILIFVYCFSFAVMGTNLAGHTGYFYWLLGNVLLLSFFLVFIHY
jgi:predicted membrane channel-forming protein YqfA (hemolysin III family)